MRNASQGFTVIELMIVVAVIALLAVALLPNLTGAQRSANISAVESILTRGAQAQQMYYTRCHTYYQTNSPACYGDGETASEVWDDVIQFSNPRNIPVTFVEGDEADYCIEAYHRADESRVYHITLGSNATLGECS